MKWRVRLEFKLADCWIGAYWCRRLNEDGVEVGRDIWICLLPCLPIHVFRTWAWNNG
jgi:hypothetical protein